MLRRAASLAPGGVLLIREADAAAGDRFVRVRIGNRLKAIVTGAWRQPLCYRRADEWTALFTRLGLDATPVASSARGHFGNVRFRVSRRHPERRGRGRRRVADRMSSTGAVAVTAPSA